MNFPNYAETKDAGIDWLGTIPKHWNTSRLKWTSPNSKNGLWGEEPDGLNDLVCVRVADFDRIRRRVNLANPTYRAIPTNQRKGRLLRRGDLLIEKSGGGEQQPVGTVVRYEHDEEAITSNFVAKLEVARGYSPNFLTYLHAMLYESGLTRRSIKQTTGIQNLDSESYFNEVVPLPPYAEQLAIADFLDTKTSAIDNLIRKKEQLIEVLQEKRQAVITQAVTKGLDPSVPVKDSGIEGFGKIPDAWNVVPLKFLCPEVTVGIVITPSKYYVEDGIPAIRSLNVREYGFDLTDLVFISNESNSMLAKSRLEKGDVVAIRTGKPGTAAVVDDNLHGANCIDLILIRKSEKIDSSYLCYYLNSNVVKNQVLGGSEGALQQHFNITTAKNLPIPMPPLHEQQQIAEFLDEQRHNIDALIAKVQRHVELIRTYRQTLITAAVTGKIDVRQYVEKRIPAAQEEVFA